MSVSHPTLAAVHAAVTAGKKFESLLKRACKNYKELVDLGLVEDHTLYRERVERIPEEERVRAYDALDEYDKTVEAFRKFVDSKAFKDYLGWSWDEPFVKWAGKEHISVGYLGIKRERGANSFIMDIDLVYELPMDRTVADLYELYGLTYLLNLRIPEQWESELMLIEFLEYTKKWPRSQLEWLVKNVYPLTDETGGFWHVVSKILAVASLREVWEDIADEWKSIAEDGLKKTPEFEVLKAVFLGDVWEAEKYVRNVVKEALEEILAKYGTTTADIEKVKEEFLDRAVALFKERVAPETKILEVYEQIKPLIPPDKVALTRSGLLSAIRWAFLHPQISVDAFASGRIFPLMFTTEQAKEIAAKILEKVTKKSVPVEVPPKIEYVKIRVLKDLPAIVGVDLKTYGPFKKREVYELPKENAEALVKQGVAVYELEYKEQYERELSSVKSEIERLGKFERLAYFLNNRAKWRFITVEDQKEMLKKIVEGWTDKDYQTFYDMYPEKVKEVAPTFTLLGLPLPPPPTPPPETVPELKEKLEEEKAKRAEAEKELAAERQKLLAVKPAVEVAPPPIKEPVPEEEQVVKRECYEIFSRLWDAIKKGAAMEVGIPTVSRRTGIGAEFIRKALSFAYERQLEKIEELTNQLIECQCEIEFKEKGVAHVKCPNRVEDQKKST